MPEEETISRRYCVMVQLEKSSTPQRLATSVPGIIALLDRWSKGEREQLCRSNDGQLFAFFIRSTKPAGMMQSELSSSPATTNADSFIIFEVGEKLGGSGFSRAWTWLQHH